MHSPIIYYTHKEDFLKINTEDLTKNIPDDIDLSQRIHGSDYATGNCLECDDAASCPWDVYELLNATFLGEKMFNIIEENEDEEYIKFSITKKTCKNIYKHFLTSSIQYDNFRLAYLNEHDDLPKAYDSMTNDIKKLCYDVGDFNSNFGVLFYDLCDQTIMSKGSFITCILSYCSQYAFDEEIEFIAMKNIFGDYHY